MYQSHGFATVQAKLLANVRTESYSPTNWNFYKHCRAIKTNVPARNAYKTADNVAINVAMPDGS